MKKILRAICLWALVLVVPIMTVALRTEQAAAEGYGMTLSPMNQSVIINPGESRKVTFNISNTYFATEDIEYELSLEPFFIDENDGIYYESEGESGRILDWTTFNIPTSGKLVPNETKEVILTIDVPIDAPAGGQYVAAIVTMNNKGEKTQNKGVNIEEIRRMAHLIYAEITGSTVKSGEIIDANVPSFMFSGKITGSSTIKNTGNVHGQAKYTLQVFPLFSGEEVYTNEEKPDTKTVMPNRTVYRELSWNETPGIGIFNVVYTVEFEGATTQVKKMVIICPIWLLFIILFLIASSIIYLISKAKKRKED